MRLLKSKSVIFSPKKDKWWNQSHAQVPIVDDSDPHYWKIYYSSRDKDGHSQISYVVVGAGCPEHIHYEHDEPILQLGDSGTFDEHGIMPTSIVSFDGIKYLYYIGWSRRNTTPFSNSIGLAISSDNGLTFEKFQGPIVGQSVYEPYFTGTAYVLRDKKDWKMWYLSCTGWEDIEPCYNIKLAISHNGIEWKYPIRTSINTRINEVAICSASVIKNNSYKMWYCYRGNRGYREGSNDSYRIGYAESKNNITWYRKDYEIEKSSEDWDSKMMAYPNVVNYKDELFMFYNGNDFGKEGFGYARIIDSPTV